MAGTDQKTVFWILTPCRSVGWHRRFWATCCFHRQGTCRNLPEPTVIFSLYRVKWNFDAICQEQLSASVALRNVRSVELTGPLCKRGDGVLFKLVQVSFLPKSSQPHCLICRNGGTTQALGPVKTRGPVLLGNEQKRLSYSSGPSIVTL